jgi:hypothetical protein
MKKNPEVDYIASSKAIGTPMKLMKWTLTPTKGDVVFFDF